MDTAYANIGLDANTTWRDAPCDGFQKCSDKLWVKLNYLKEKKHHQVGEKGKVVTVRDVIPQSKLAQYGQYPYDNGREMMYNREKPFQFFEERSKRQDEPVQETWMLADVEREFRRLTRNCSQPYDLYNGFKPIDCVEVEDSIQQKYPVLAKKCQPHAIDAEETLETIYLPNPFYRISDLNQLELQMRITSTKHIWENPVRNLMYLINSENYIQQMRCSSFPEIQYGGERHSERTKQCLPLPSLSPASRSPPSHTPLASSLRLIESLGDISTKQSLRTPSKTSQSTDNRNDFLPMVKKKSFADGHDFTNLTLLTRPVNRREIAVPERTNPQVPDIVLKWLQTGYPTRSKEFSAIQNLSDELRNVRCTLQGSSVSGIVKDRQEKYSDEPFVEKKYEFCFESNTNANFDHLVYRSETNNLSASLSSSSSTEQIRSLNAKSSTKFEVPKLTYSSASSGESSNFWKGESSSLWSQAKPFNKPGPNPSVANFARDNLVHRFSGKTKFRSILNSPHGEISELETAGYSDEAQKKRPAGGMADVRIFGFYEGNPFDDLERQAIEQWPSDDSLDVFRSHHLQSVVNNRPRRMTTKLRHPQAPLRTVNPNSTFLGRNTNSSKRKSAVQMLQETKAFYVKSETVLDKKQEFRPGKVAEPGYGNFGLTEKVHKCEQRDSGLQDKLRILLDLDAIESRGGNKNSNRADYRSHRSFDRSTCFQHKSLPDLHVSPTHSSAESSDSSFGNKCDGDSRSAYSSLTQPESHVVRSTNSSNCRRSVKSSNDCKITEFQAHSRFYAASFHATKSGESFASKTGCVQSSYQRRCSNTSSCNRSRHNSSSKHSQSADSGRQSQGGSVGLRTGRSGLPEFPVPPSKSAKSDSGTEDDFPPLFRKESPDVDRKRPILRSKSDISYKYCVGKAKPLLSPTIRPSLPTTEKLETFFDHLGMNPLDYKDLATENSGNSSPVFFSSISSVDSCVDVALWSVPEPCKAAECPSIVERNARIIKWLYNCRKFQRTVFTEGKTTAAVTSAVTIAQ